jgi:hypothetical protein
MHFGFRRTAILLSAGALIFCCSCEEHHLGEMPEVQRERVELASGSAEDSDVVKERSAAQPTPSAKPTPAEFFPETTPP